MNQFYYTLLEPVLLHIGDCSVTMNKEHIISSRGKNVYSYNKNNLLKILLNLVLKKKNVPKQFINHFCGHKKRRVSHRQFLQDTMLPIVPSKGPNKFRFQRVLTFRLVYTLESDMVMSARELLCGT
jgi:hypothetical protein